MSYNETTDRNSSGQRYYSLDALRGIAALLVIFYHFSLTYPHDTGRNVSVWETVVSRIGSGSVILFFVLSGFVLTLSMQGKTGWRSYFGYYVRRIFRLYPIYILATTAVFFIKFYFLDGPLPADVVSPWYNIGWKIQVSFTEFLKILTLVLDFDTWALDGPSWTLVFEMRISLIMPLLLMAFGYRKLPTVLLFMLLGATAMHVDWLIPRVDNYYATDMSLSNWMGTVVYLSYFVAGMALAYEKDKVFAFFDGLPAWGKAVWIFIGLALYANRAWLPLPAAALPVYSGTLLTVTGTVAMMVFVVRIKACSRFFELGIFQVLGKISYGIYLWHMVFLFLYVALFIDKMSLEAIFAITLATTLAVSWITYYAVELPFIKLGRRLSKRITCNGR